MTWKIITMGADRLRVLAQIRVPLRSGGTKGPMEPHESGKRRSPPSKKARASCHSTCKAKAAVPRIRIVFQPADAICMWNTLLWADQSTTGSSKAQDARVIFEARIDPTIMHPSTAKDAISATTKFSSPPHQTAICTRHEIGDSWCCKPDPKHLVSIAGARKTTEGQQAKRLFKNK